jgi:hypothetical protein
MSPVLVSLFTFVAVACGALIGLELARRLPETHLSGDGRTAVSVAMAVVGTLTALVIGLMISTANSAFSARVNAVETLAMDIVKLDRVLRRYGSDTDSTRDFVGRYAALKADELTHRGEDATPSAATLALLESIDDQVTQLQPTDDRGRRLKEQAIGLLEGIAEARWLLAERADITVPTPFLILVILWLSLLFASFGLFAPRNATVVAFHILGAAAISGGILMILELGTPTQGLVRVPIAPLVAAAEQLKAGERAAAAPYRPSQPVLQP